jgi:probable addiction module antidote protein
MRDRSHDEATAELLRKDPDFAADYLNEVLEQGDQAELLVALRQLSKAFGGVTQVAEGADLNPTQLYRALSPEGNPELRSLIAILRVMDLQLSVKRIGAR